MCGARSITLCSYEDGSNLTAAVAAAQVRGWRSGVGQGHLWWALLTGRAQNADVVIVVGATTSSEGSDRANLNLVPRARHERALRE